MTHNRRYQKVIACHYPGGPILEVDIISTIYETEQTLYTVPMCDISPSEIHMQDGRFLLFVDEAQEHLIITNIRDNQETFKEQFTERLEWISANVFHSWHFDIDIPSLTGPAYILWSFEDVSDALLFKLTF